MALDPVPALTPTPPSWKPARRLYARDLAGHLGVDHAQSLDQQTGDSLTATLRSELLLYPNATMSSNQWDVRFRCGCARPRGWGFAGIGRGAAGWRDGVRAGRGRYRAGWCRRG